jgi:hypothetical protein
VTEGGSVVTVFDGDGATEEVEVGINVDVFGKRVGDEVVANVGTEALSSVGTEETVEGIEVPVADCTVVGDEVVANVV